MRLSQVSTGTLTIWARRALIAATVVAAVVATVAFRSVAHTAEDVRARTSQAALELLAARSALIDADRAAITTFGSGGADLAGPGQDYQNQIAAAAQSLARFAQLTGSQDVQNLQVVEGMLASYSASIAQADAYEHQRGGSFLAMNELWDASQLVHQTGGILDQIQTLQQHQRAAADRQVGSGWLDPWTIPVWAFLIALVLALLAATQIMCYRRFRRRLNVGLLAATALTLILAGTMIFTAVSAHRLQAAHRQLQTVLSTRSAQVHDADTAGQYRLAGLLRQGCIPRGTCGYTVDAFIAATHPASAPEDSATSARGRTRAVNQRLQVAAETYGLGVTIPVVGAGVVVCIGAGLYSRIAEYRFNR